MKVVFFLLFLGLPFLSAAQDKLPTAADFQEIRDILDFQENAWNEGNLEKFMEAYWQSDSLRFTSSGRTSMGWQKTLEGYYETYPSLDEMGKLKFEIFDLYGVTSEVAALSGTYYLTRKEKDLSGFYTLIFRKIEGQWKIVADTTCAD